MACAETSLGAKFIFEIVYKLPVPNSFTLPAFSSVLELSAIVNFERSAFEVTVKFPSFSLKRTYFLFSSGFALKIKLISPTLASSSSSKNISSLSFSFETTNSTTGFPLSSFTNL